MEGLVQKPVTAPVVLSSWASDWPELLQKLSFWLASIAPAAESNRNQREIVSHSVSTSQILSSILFHSMFLDSNPEYDQDNMLAVN